MDAFEQLAADIFRAKGYWVSTGFKVNLLREDKLAIGLPSSPRWEIDLVAYKAATNELLVLECKSYLDSGGVHAAHFEPTARLAGRYKLFNNPELRGVVLERLRVQLLESGLCRSGVSMAFGLVYAHATPHNERRLAERFEAEGWLRFGPEWVCDELAAMAQGGYENSVAAIVAKLLLRDKAAPRRTAVPARRVGRSASCL